MKQALRALPLSLLTALFATAALAPAAQAQGYPPGGSARGGFRPVGGAVGVLLGQPMLVEYKPGNAAGVATEFTAKAAPDGYTLYFYDSGPLTVAPHLLKTGYNSVTSFTHFGHVCGSGSMLVAHPSTPFNTVSDVVAASKRDPNKWSYGTSGVAGPHHLSGEYFKNATGANLLHIPYKGGGPAMADLMGGQVPLLFSSLGPVVGAIKTGKVPPIPVPPPPRRAPFPDVPTMDEAGVKGFDPNAWYGLLGPAGMPPEVVARINQAMAKAAEDKSLREQINATGCDVEFLTPMQNVEKIKIDLAKWGKVVKDANIKAE